MGFNLRKKRYPCISFVREIEWQRTFNKCIMHGAVIAQANSPYGKMYRRTAKTTLTFEQSNGGTIHMFHLYNSSRKT